MKKLIFLLALCCSGACFGQAVYVNGFSATSASPSDVPNTINANLSYGSWTISTGSFTSFAGASGQALSMSSASATTTTWTLPLTVNSGYSLALTSFSFWNRASSSGYTNWQVDIDGTVIGSGTVSTSGASTGTISITGPALTAVSALTGTVNVHLVWSGGTHGGTGTGRLDDFTLNGTVSVAGCTGTPTAGTASAGSNNVCLNGSTTLTLSGASSGSGITYQWQSSADNATWSNIGSATGLTYTTPALTAGTYYRCVTTCSNSGVSSTSNSVSVSVTATVTPSVSITANTAATVCAGTTVTYTAAPVNGGPAPAYQWKLAGTTIPGATNATYAYMPANGDAVSCVLTSNAGCASPTTATSNVVTMTVNPLPAPTISGSTTISSGGSTNLTFTGVSGDIITYTDGSSSNNITLSGTSANVSVSPVVTTTYSITSATGANACTKTITGQSATVTVSSTDTIPTRDNNLAMGNPSGATTAATDSNNYLLVKSQYTLSYNNSKGMANWASWHLSRAWLGGSDRCDCFTQDGDLPNGYYKASTSNYSNTGFDRGHLCPSADRTASDTDNANTFKMTNISPQAPMLNEVPWGALENYCRSLVAQGKELYIIAGAYGSGGSGSNGGTTTSIASGHINVPDHFYKIIVVLPVGSNDVARVTKTTTAIAVIMPNTQAANSHTWDYYRTTIDSIEGITGYNFLSNVPDSVQAVIEANSSAGPNTLAAWDFTGANSASTFAATTFNAHLDTTYTRKNITRGATASASTGANSFRTTGFKNDGIATSNTDYFQATIKAKTNYTVSLTTLSAAFQGTGSFYASPGVTSQYAYSLDGTNFTLIDTPVTTTALTGSAIDLSGISALQNVPDSVTITIRYYASGQTTTGGWGFYSSATGANGFAIIGNADTVVHTGMKMTHVTTPVAVNASLAVTMQPNPATNVVKISFTAPKTDHMLVRITDMAGRVVYYNDMGMQQAGTTMIPVNNLAPGIYFTEVSSGNQKVVKKLVKE